MNFDQFLKSKMSSGNAEKGQFDELHSTETDASIEQEPKTNLLQAIELLKEQVDIFPGEEYQRKCAGKIMPPGTIFKNLSSPLTPIHIAIFLQDIDIYKGMFQRPELASPEQKAALILTNSTRHPGGINGFNLDYLKAFLNTVRALNEIVTRN